MIGSCMICEIISIFHHPTTVFGLLPFVDGLCYIDVYVLDIAHAEGMESDLHCCSIADLLRVVYELLDHWEDFEYGLGTSPSHFLVFSLCSVATPEFDEMHP